MGYTNIFGGSPVKSALETYLQLSLTANTTLVWPVDNANSVNVVADTIDVTPSSSGFTITLPSALQGSLGATCVINNLSGSFTFSVLNAGGSTILTCAVGTVWFLYLADNSTANGTWRSFQFGAQAGSVNVAAIAGSGLLAVGSSLNQSMPVSSKNANYVAVNGDRASTLLWTGAAGTITLPSAATVASNWFVNIRNSGTGDITVSPPSGTIDGAVSKTFTAGVGSAIIFTDGTNYYTIGYGGSGTTSGFDYTTINVAGTGDYTITGAELNRISYKLTGILTGNRNFVVPATVQEYWINNATTGAFTLTVKTAAGTGQTVSQGGQAIVYCDGTNVIAGTSGITLPVPLASGGTGATTAAAARTALGSTAVGDALYITASAAAARTTLGSTTVGDAVFIAANAAAAQSALSLAAIAASGSASDLSAGTVPAARMPAFTGDITTVSGAVATTLATVNANVGSFGSAANTLSITVNGKGLITAASAAAIAITAGQVSGLAASATTDTTNAGNISAGTLLAARMPALTGDITTSAGAVATTLATVNANVGSFGSASSVATFTVNAKGLITAAGSTSIAIASGAVSGLAASATTDTTNATNITSGALPAGRMPALTGDVTTSAGAVATTIAAGAVTASKVGGGVLRQGSLGSGVITVQSGGTASGGSDGDIFLIY